ncbi:energy-coupling factor ABC transporter permease [Streptomyces sp. YIM 98790]|uniref:energy-coupling factor ABC transporter permease n=1 Tax=Streptomyces sp. YIM 98790 TaxID=2689077 RepID=UPI00140BD0F2|nr:energy-coupling factor ABC transporter permease [Streptomyces sp. YIM 98790]
MHVPDGFFDAPVSVAGGAIAVTAVAVSLRGARRELAERTAGGAPGGGAERLAPLAGLVAAFVFAVQMLNFPVGAGTSGHLMGGALAAILIGPHTGILVLSVVLTVQALLFADGGLSALGINITLLGVVAVVVAWGVFRLLLRLLPERRQTVTAASFTAAFVSVPAAAAVFTLLYAIGGTADVPVGTVLGAMVGVHAAIGVGEGVITALTVGAVLAARPDLVHGMRRPAPVRRPARLVWIGGLAATLLCAAVVSGFASASPDGLEKVAGEHGLDEEEREHPLAGSWLEDYGVVNVDNERLSVGLAGIIGAGVTLTAATAAFTALRRNARERTDAPAERAAAGA